MSVFASEIGPGALGFLSTNPEPGRGIGQDGEAFSQLASTPRDGQRRRKRGQKGGQSPVFWNDLQYSFSRRICSCIFPIFSHLYLLFGVFQLLFYSNSPNRFTCEGFLLLLKGCMLGPDDFEFVSGLVFLAA